jgi:hypothetical protein
MEVSNFFHSFHRLCNRSPFFSTRAMLHLMFRLNVIKTYSLTLGVSSLPESRRIDRVSPIKARVTRPASFIFKRGFHLDNFAHNQLFGKIHLAALRAFGQLCGKVMSEIAEGRFSLLEGDVAFAAYQPCCRRCLLGHTIPHQRH